MMTDQADVSKIIVVGFGRSGTTWLSDIIAKCQGGLMLFEPFHPQVCDFSREVIYNSFLPTDANQFINKISTQCPVHPWLLRNVVGDPIEKTPTSTIQYLWETNNIIGFKTVRALHSLEDLSNHRQNKIIWIHRHPLAVIASLDRRTNYWLDIGWETHKQLYFDRVLLSNDLTPEMVALTKELLKKNLDQYDVQAIMWSLSYVIGRKQADRVGAHVVSYEDLYLDPYKVTRELLEYLGNSATQIHPSYLFTPSMTTMRTVHLERDIKKMDQEDLDAMFWKKRFSKNKAVSLLDIVDNIITSSG